MQVHLFRLLFALNFLVSTLAVHSESPLGENGPTTKAEQELEKILKQPSSIDMLRASFLISSDIPKYKSVSFQKFKAMHDKHLSRVSNLLHHAKLNPWIAGSLSNPENKMFVYCSGLVQGGIRYHAKFSNPNLTLAQRKEMYANPDNLFLIGLLDTNKGTCVNMPLLYLTVGRKIDLPVHLVSVGKHYFIRWEERGFRMNIETTVVSKVHYTPNDSVYLDIEKIDRRNLAKSNVLRNLTEKEVIAQMLYTRASHYHAVGQIESSKKDIARALHLAPRDPYVRQAYNQIHIMKGK